MTQTLYAHMNKRVKKDLKKKCKRQKHMTSSDDLREKISRIKIINILLRKKKDSTHIFLY
jgi:hypothetical protein